MLVFVLVLPLFIPLDLLSQVPLQVPGPSGSTRHIEETSSKRTAQLSWPPSKRSRTSDAEGTRTVFIGDPLAQGIILCLHLLLLLVPQVWLAGGSDPQRVTCKTSRQLRE